MKWINASGLILQFLAFWFAAPELLGESTLKRFESGLRKFIGRIPILLLMVGVLAYAFLFAVIGLMKGLDAAKHGMEETEMYRFFWVLGLSSLAYFVAIIFYKRILNWLDRKLALPLTEKLIHNNQTRKTALLIGGVLFSIGFILQRSAVIIAPN